MYTLSSQTKQNIEKVVGLSLSQLSDLSTDEEKEYIESRSGKSLVFSKKRNMLETGRGNPLLARRRLRTMDDIEKLSKKIFGI